MGNNVPVFHDYSSLISSIQRLLRLETGLFVSSISCERVMLQLIPTPSTLRLNSSVNFVDHVLPPVGLTDILCKDYQGVSTLTG